MSEFIADPLAEIERLRAELEEAEQSRTLNHVAAKMALDQRDDLLAKYRSAVNTLRDIAQMSGKMGCETAAHRLAMLGEPRYLPEDLPKEFKR